MTRHLLVALTIVVAAGCSMPTLPYYPARQPPGATVSVAYHLADNQLRMEIDTGHRRLEEALIIKADGTAVRAQAIEVAPSATQGNTFAVFPGDEAGPPPWRLNLRLTGTEPLEIRVGPGAGWVR